MLSLYICLRCFFLSDKRQLFYYLEVILPQNVLLYSLVVYHKIKILGYF